MKLLRFCRKTAIIGHESGLLVSSMSRFHKDTACCQSAPDQIVIMSIVLDRLRTVCRTGRTGMGGAKSGADLLTWPGSKGWDGRRSRSACQHNAVIRGLGFRSLRRALAIEREQIKWLSLHAVSLPPCTSAKSSSTSWVSSIKDGHRRSGGIFGPAFPDDHPHPIAIAILRYRL